MELIANGLYQASGAPCEFPGMEPGLYRVVMNDPWASVTNGLSLPTSRSRRWQGRCLGLCLGRHIWGRK